MDVDEMSFLWYGRNQAQFGQQTKFIVVICLILYVQSHWGRKALNLRKIKAFNFKQNYTDYFFFSAVTVKVGTNTYVIWECFSLMVHAGFFKSWN